MQIHVKNVPTIIEKISSFISSHKKHRREIHGANSSQYDL